MTMPNERTRSLRWGWELLQELKDAAVLNAENTHCVVEILKNYPQPEEIKALANEEEIRAQRDSLGGLFRFLAPEQTPEIPDYLEAAKVIGIEAERTSEVDFAQGLTMALGLFERLQCAPQLPQALKSQLPLVLRHYPDLGGIKYWKKRFAASSNDDTGSLTTI